MKVKVPLKYEIIKEQILVENGEYKTIDIKKYYPDVNVSYIVVSYNIKQGYAIIEIHDKEYQEIKDKVIEVLG